MRKLTTVALSTALAGGMVLTLAPTSSAATSIRSEALKIAAKQKGDRYKRGATGPNRFDCSGLVHFAYKKAGYRWKKRLSAQGQYNMSRKISASNRKVGDLVFIGTSKKGIYHVGIYAGWKNGKGWMWNANSAPYRGYKVVKAPISEYTKGSPKAFYGRIG